MHRVRLPRDRRRPHHRQHDRLLESRPRRIRRPHAQGNRRHHRAIQHRRGQDLIARDREIRVVRRPRSRHQLPGESIERVRIARHQPSHARPRRLPLAHPARIEPHIRRRTRRPRDREIHLPAPRPIRIRHRHQRGSRPLRRRRPRDQPRQSIKRVGRRRFVASVKAASAKITSCAAGAGSIAQRMAERQRPIQASS